ncbi:MAG: hypothetical protein FWC78_08230 [Defluviitaleaceae bacterium]|nr:hypothetical protein [Defluviitaleaceae bacterium]
MFGKTTYVLIEETAATIYAAAGKNSWEQDELPFCGQQLEDMANPENLQQLVANAAKLKLPRLMGELRLVMHSHRTAIRVAELPAEKPKKPSSEWAIIEENFPLGGKMNENSHVFDGSIFANPSGQQHFLMAALPMEICEAAGKLGEGIFRRKNKIKAIEVIEHLVMRHHAGQAEEMTLIVLPQGDRLRLMQMVNCLPCQVYAINSNPEYRENEFSRIWKAFNENLPTKLLVLDSGQEWEWLQKFISNEEAEVEVEIEAFDFAKYIAG